MQETILNNRPTFKFTIQNFEGPLDVLLFLITKNKMSIFDISLSELTDEYINYINELTEQNIELASEFIVMAATLLDIKSRKLLPELEPKEEDEEVLSEQDIIDKIIAYKKYKEIASVINDMYSKNFGSFSKPFEKIKYKIKSEYSGQKLESDEMYEIYTSILSRNANKVNRNAEEINKLAVYEKVTVQDKVRQIVNYLHSNKQMVFNDVFNINTCENIEVVTAFLGVLELSKLKQVNVHQQYLFSDINVVKNNDATNTIDLSSILE